MTPHPERSKTGTDDCTRVQSDLPPQTLEFAVDSTNPSFGTLSPGGVPDYPFLSPPQAADEIGRLGEYRILKKLGEGGMGFVFRGEDPALKRFIALKVMRPEVAAKPMATDRFLREGRAAAGLKSDHIITIYQVGQANGVPFLAMEFLEGLPLDEWFKLQKKAIPLPHVLRVVRDTLRGLAIAHDKGLIHRDIKPANLWLEKGTSRIKILDFGLTRGNESDVQLTQEGAVVGTPAFMAPEQASGKPVDPRADLFSVGVVMYTLLAGKNPFARGSLMETLGAVGFETQAPVTTVRPDVPKEYSDFLDRLLAKTPDARPANAKAALSELVAIEKTLQEGNRTLSATAASQPMVVVPLSAPAPQVWDEITDADDAPPTRPSRTKDAGPPKPQTNKKLLFGGGLFALLAVLGGIIIIITNKDGTKTKIEVPDDAKVEVKDKGKTVASVGGKKTPPKKVVMDADRKAAEWVIGRGGELVVDAGKVSITEISQLPTEPFRVTSIRLSNATSPMTDADLDALRDLTALVWLDISGPITDVGLKKLSGFPFAKSLNNLLLNQSRITDAGLVVLPELSNLNQLTLQGAKELTGTGLSHLKGTQIQQLGLAETGLTDDGLGALNSAGLSFKQLSIHTTQITDAGMKHLGQIKVTGHLQMGFCPNVTDAGMRELEGMTELQIFEFGGRGNRLTPRSLSSVGKLSGLEDLQCSFSSPATIDDLKPVLVLEHLEVLRLNSGFETITDEDLTTLSRKKSLRILSLSSKAITADGAKAFHKARPDVKLTTVHGTLEATVSDPERRAAEFVIGRGGSMDITGHGVVSEAAKLPAESFVISHINLNNPNQPITDAELDQFQGLKDLQILHVKGPISDAGLAKLAAFPKMASLKELIVYSPDLTDAALASAPKFAGLVRFQLNFSKKVTGEGLAHLKGSNIQALHLCGTSLADGQLVKLKDLPKLHTLDLTENPITDAGLQVVGGLKQLKFLLLYGVLGVTDAGAKHLEGLTELETLQANGVPFGEAGFASLAKLPMLKYLNGPNMPNVTDAGMKALAKSPSLEGVHFEATPLTDAGLAALAACKTLKFVQATKTKVTADGAKAFHKARPDVTLTTDHGQFEANPAASPPATDPDRAAAEKLLSQFDLDILPAGKTEVLKLKAGSPVPAGTFAVTGVRCWALDRLPRTFADDVLLPAIAPLTRLTSLEDPGSKLDMDKSDPAKWPRLASKESLRQFELAVPLTDAWLDAFRQFPNLTAIHVSNGKNVPIETLRRLSELKGLTSLRVFNLQGADRWAAVTALPLKKLLPSASPDIDRAACERIAAMPELETLSVYDMKFSSEMLLAIGASPSIRAISITKCEIPASGFDGLARLAKLYTLTIKVKEFDDAPLAQLAGSRSLQYLFVKDTAVTEAGVMALAAKLPNCTIEWSGGRVKGH